MLENRSFLSFKKFSNLWILCVWILISFALYLFNTTGQLNFLVAWLVILVSLHSLFKSRKSLYLFIIYGFIFYSNYSICIANYIYPIQSYFTSWANLPIAKEGLYILLFFTVCLNAIVPINIIAKSPILISNNKQNIFISSITLFALICIGVFAFGRPEDIGSRGAPTPLYEYSTILAILGIYYSGKIRLLHIAYISVLIGFALQNFIFGGRVTGIQLLICIFLCFYSDRFKLRQIFPFVLIGFLLMSAVGQFRSNLSLNTETLIAVIDNLKNNKMVLDTAYSAYFTSLTFLAVLDFMNWPSRIYLLSRFVIYIIIGSGVADSNLALITRNYFMHYMGGVVPFFGYFYLGVLGVLLLVWYLYFLFKHVVNITEKSSGLWRCLAIYITITTLRWYLYSPSQLLRGVFLFIICYGGCYMFHQTTYRSIKKNNI